MNVDDLGFRDVGNVMPLFFRPLSPGQVFQPGQSLVVGILLPQTLSDGGVGIVAERRCLPQITGFRLPLKEDLFFRIAS